MTAALFTQKSNRLNQMESGIPLFIHIWFSFGQHILPPASPTGRWKFNSNIIYMYIPIFTAYMESNNVHSDAHLCKTSSFYFSLASDLSSNLSGAFLYLPAIPGQLIVRLSLLRKTILIPEY